MLTIAINTASSNTAIALLSSDRNGTYELLAENSWQSENNEAERLMPEIDSLLKSEKKSFDEIGEVFVIRGPGSFTGLRVGVTVANTLAYLNKCPLKAIDAFDYYWSAIENPENAAVLIFAGSRGVYLNRKDSGSETEILNIDSLAENLKASGIEKVYGDISHEQKEALGGIEFTEIEKSFGELTSQILSEGLAEDFQIVKPLYVKGPAITKSKKSLYNQG